MEKITVIKLFRVMTTNRHKVMGLNFNSKDKLCTRGKLMKFSGRPRESVDPPSLEALKTNVLRET